MDFSSKIKTDKIKIENIMFKLRALLTKKVFLQTKIDNNIIRKKISSSLTFLIIIKYIKNIIDPQKQLKIH